MTNAKEAPVDRHSYDRAVEERDALRKALVDVMNLVGPQRCDCSNLANSERPCTYCRARKALAGGKP